DGRLLLNMTRVPLRFRPPRAAQQAVAAAPPAGAAAANRPPAATAGGAGAGVPVQPQATALFLDDTFDAGWTASKLVDTSSRDEATFYPAQLLAGGNPGAYRQTTLSISEGTLIVGHIRDDFVHDPAASGAIQSVFATVDVIDLDSPSPGR